MQNMVKNSYAAYRVDNSTDYGNYLSVTGFKFQDDIFSFDLWLYLEEDGSEIISQNGGFGLGISQDKVIIKIPGKSNISIRSAAFGIPKKEWINLYFGYNGKTIEIFVNGNSIGEADCTGRITNNNEIVIGREFTGYLRSFRLYFLVLDEETFRNYFMASEYQASKMKELQGFLDLSQKEISDLSGKGLSAQVCGSCTYMDLVDVYCPAMGGFAYIDDSEEVNPGGFESKEFSVYMKLYLRPSANGKQLLWINGEWNDEDSVSLITEKQDGKTKFIFMYGKKEYTFDFEITDYAWTDVLTAVKDNKLTAYINGEKRECTLTDTIDRKKYGSFKIGGCQKNSDMTTEHYIHSVAVFDKALGEADAADFLKDHPFVFEDGLAALVSFEGCKALELTNGTVINASEKGLFPAQRTVDKLPTDEYNFRLNYTKAAASDMKKWEAEQVLAGYRDFAVKMGGCSVTASSAVLETLVRYLSNHSKLLQKSAKLYSKPTIQSADAVSAIGKTDPGLIKTMFNALKLSAAVTTAASSTAMVGSTAVTSSAYKYAAIFAVGCAAAVVTASVIAATVNDIHKDKPDDDDDDDKDLTVKLLSVTFQHDPDSYDRSAVRCRNYQGVVNAPEWTHDKKCTAPALYIANQIKKAKIKFRFKIIDNSKKKASSYAVSFSANVFSGEKNLFDDLTYKAEGLKADVEYEAVAESGITASVKQTISYSQITLWWSCDVNGNELCLPNTKSDIYVIPQIPATPIFLQRGCDNYLPAIEYLDFFAQILSQDHEKKEVGSLGVTSAHLKWIASMIFYSPWFEYLGQPTPEYVLREATGTHGGAIYTFMEGNFFRDINEYRNGRREKLQIECEVYACIFGYYLNMLNVPFHIDFIANTQGTEDDNNLHTNAVYSAGHINEAPKAHKFEYHVVVGVEGFDNKPVTIYDTSLGYMDGTTIRPFTGLEFQPPAGGPICNAAAEANYYRGRVFQDNTGATDNLIQIAFEIAP